MININSNIYSILSASTAITSYVDGRIYPLIAPANSDSPLIVFKSKASNDRTFDTDVISYDLELIVISNSHDQCIVISDLVTETLNRYSDPKIRKIIFLDDSKNYSESIHYKNLLFKIQV